MLLVACRKRYFEVLMTLIESWDVNVHQITFEDESPFSHSNRLCFGTLIDDLYPLMHYLQLTDQCSIFTDYVVSELFLPLLFDLPIVKFIYDMPWHLIENWRSEKRGFKVIEKFRCIRYYNCGRFIIRLVSRKLYMMKRFGYSFFWAAIRTVMSSSLQS